MIDYIGKAKLSIDIAIYNFNNSNLSNISTALNAAADRGVNIRIIYCGTTNSAGADELGTKIKKLMGPGSKNTNYPNRDGIMHNKFMVVDALSTNANEPFVWTGSTNWTDGNMNTDPNNVIIVQDQSLAKVYTAEFEEMWGSNTMDPNMSKAKFGNQKADNTPTELVIAGKRVECYFSPSGKVNSRIIALAKTAEKDLNIALMLITPRDMAYAVSDANHQGALAKCIVNSKSDCIIQNTDGTDDLRTVNALAGACKENFIDYNAGGTMHNKYMIVDATLSTSDPLVLTGSHNWSSSADGRNDENTLVIHDATLANIYYQNFNSLITKGTVITDVPVLAENGETVVYPNPTGGSVNVNYFASRVTDASVSVFDLAGRKIFANTFRLNEGANTMNLDLNAVRGIYLLKVEANGKTFNQKISVQ